MKPPRVVVAGNSCVDLVCGPLTAPPGRDRSVRVDSVVRDIGGCGANTARSLALLGTPVALVSCVGDDPEGGLVSEQLARHGVATAPLHRCRNGRTGLSICLAGSRARWRSFIYHPGANLELDPGLVRAHLPPRFDQLHMAGFWGAPGMTGTACLELFREAHCRGAHVSIDMSWTSARDWRVAPAVLAEADVVFPNEQEACAVTGCQSAEEAAGVFHEIGVDLAVITRADRGALISTKSGGFVLPAYRVDPVDAVGAGDAFAAGFISEIIRLGFDPTDPARLAAQGRLAMAAGALAVSGPGGRGRLQDRQGAEALIRSQA